MFVISQLLFFHFISSVIVNIYVCSAICDSTKSFIQKSQSYACNAAFFGFRNTKNVAQSIDTQKHTHIGR